MSFKVAVIVAGTNEPSNSNVMADAFIEGMRAIEGIQVEKIRLKDVVLDHFTLQNYHPDYRGNDDFPHIENMVKDANAVVFASPIWNFSIPAHLKNLIDRMGAFA